MNHRGRRRVAALAPALALVLAATGCGSASDPSPPAGVDELVIPTPTPDATDFVDVVDNPWLALTSEPAPTYTNGDGQPVERRVAPGPRVAGVPTTAVTLGAETDYYAQDRGGNVWWFGRAGEWQAGVGGAEAGLLMAATPRVGDGYRRAGVPGVELRAEVVDVDVDEVVLELVTDDVVERASYQRGVGLVLVETEDGLAELELDEAS